MNKEIVFIDMDGVLADFDGALSPEHRRPTGASAWDPPEMFEPGFYRSLNPMPGSLFAVKMLMEAPHLDVFIGSKPTTKNLACPSEKYEWIDEYFPALLKRIVLVCDKSLLRGDILIDDDKDRWESSFHGRFIHFNREKPEESWAAIVADLVWSR